MSRVLVASPEVAVAVSVTATGSSPVAGRSTTTVRDVSETPSRSEAWAAPSVTAHSMVEPAAPTVGTETLVRTLSALGTSIAARSSFTRSSSVRSSGTTTT